MGPESIRDFPAELIRYGQLAALASRVGWDDRDLAKLQQGSADLAWVSKVAVRHHEIIGSAGATVGPCSRCDWAPFFAPGLP